MTLATRLSLFFLSTLAFVLVGFSAALYLLAESHLHRQAQERLNAMLNTISSLIETGNDGVEWEPGNRSLNLDSAIDGDQVVWLVADDRGNVLGRSKSRNTDLFLADTSPTLQLTAQSKSHFKRNGASWEAGQRWIHPDIRLPYRESPTHSQEGDKKHRALSVTVGVSLIPIRATLSQLSSALIGLSMVIWFLALAAGRFVCRRALLPVNRMAVAAREINADDLAQRLPAVATNDELEDLNRAFNNLLDRLQITFERQRRFTGDASHQLRTPLTAILGQIEVALRRERTAPEYRQVLEKVQRRASHLARMAESLLFLARADAEAIRPVSEPVNLTEWLPQHLQTWSEHSRARDMAIHRASDQLSMIHAQPALLGELLDILLDNACKFSEPATPITVRLQQVENTVSVSVEDHGCGIEDNDLANVFVPFCRSEEARRRGIEGVGLGLSIAKRLAEVFGGEFTVVSRPSQGSCFTLRFVSR